jgi:hypothetical protein
VAAPAQEEVPFSERTTTAGDVELTTSNYGRFGNDYRNRSSSFEFPAKSGHEHMTRGGLWIGGVALDPHGGVDTLVTTAVLDAYVGSAPGQGTEFTPRRDPSWPPLTYILERSRQRTSPFFSPDAIADQEFFAVFDDRDPIDNPSDPHVPLDLGVRQHVFLWGFEPFDAIVFINFEITNLNDSRDIFDVYVGFYTELTTGDKDAAPSWPPGGYWFGAKDIGFVDSLRLVTERRAANDNVYAPTWCGAQLLGVNPGDVEEMNFAFNWWDWNPNAEDRDSDPERYAVMSNGQTDDTSFNEAASGLDPAMLVSVGPFRSLGAAQADTIRLSVALLGGRDLAELVDHGTRAVAAFDRGFRIPVPPPVPRFVLQPGPHEITVRWEDSPEYAIDPETEMIDFEGYRVYVSDRGTSESFELVKEADVVDDYQLPPGEGQEDIRFNTGLGALIADDPLTVVDGADTLTFKYKYVLKNLRDGFNYWTAVTAFDRGGLDIGPLESGVSLTRTLVVPGTRAAGGGGSEPAVGVFPNPYRGDAAWDGANRRDRYLWFVNLPARCRIKIYTLAGDLVDTIDFDGRTYDARDVRGIYDPTDPNDPESDLPVLSGGMAAWDLITRHDQAIATGLYIFSVENLDTGKRQVGRFLVVK